jgi:hypothetical protein
MVALRIEVRPRYLIPDTNCFIDDLSLIKSIANAYDSLHYQLMIPITGEFTNQREESCLYPERHLLCVWYNRQ